MPNIRPEALRRFIEAVSSTLVKEKGRDRKAAAWDISLPTPSYVEKNWCGNGWKSLRAL
jgi:hypothetical protein